MKRLATILALLAVCVGCEYEFELEEGNLDNKLFVNCVVRGSDTTFVTVKKCVPVNKTVAAQDRLPEMEYLRLFAGDKQLNLVYDGEKDDYNNWYTLDKVEAGASLRIEAKAKDTAPVNAICTAPSAPSIKSVKTDFCKVDDNYLETVIELNDKDARGGYYGVVMFEHVWISTVWDPEFNPYDFPDEEGEEVSSNGLASNILPESSEILSESTEYYPYLRWDKKSLNTSYWRSENNETINLISAREMEKSGGVIKVAYYYRNNFDDDVVQEYSWDYGEGESYYEKHKCHHTYYLQRKFKVYRLSEEFYHYAMARIAQDSNALAEIGLAPAVFAYSNIDGGYGVLAGCACVETDWMENI